MRQVKYLIKQYTKLFFKKKMKYIEEECGQTIINKKQNLIFNGILGAKA